MTRTILSVLLFLVAAISTLAAPAAKCVTYGEGTLTTSETTFQNGTFNGTDCPCVICVGFSLTSNHVLLPQASSNHLPSTSAENCLSIASQSTQRSMFNSRCVILGLYKVYHTRVLTLWLPRFASPITLGMTTLIWTKLASIWHRTNEERYDSLNAHRPHLHSCH